ncbi:unnamed protein product [Rhizoctonia solani]|uniref:Uncharacterized protein n=1 Tax=Rhizoctonia solani TaxID=456999 RepID=A0A8H3DIR5_9AGAM|nr:unnamed protein product [Rhizoctonia solani]
MSDKPTINDREAYVHSAAFDEECAVLSKRLSSRCGSPECSEWLKLWEDDDSSSVTSVGSSGHTVPKLEAHAYYYGIRGRRHLGPKLVYRTSKDIFTRPPRPGYLRAMQLVPVYEHKELGQDDLWDAIRGEVVKLLDARDIQFTSVDLARFRWEESNKGGSSKTVITPVTIWIGVLPDSLTGEVAFESSNDILQLLKKHNIHDIDVAYRESVTKPLAGVELFAPANDYDPLKDVLDPVTTALGLPIAGLRRLHMEGTLGFYFRVGDTLFGVTPRHVLFSEGDNSHYSYNGGPKKEVVLMGTNAFDDFLTSIQLRISTLNVSVAALRKRIATFKKRADAGDQQVATELGKAEVAEKDTIEAIEKLKTFFLKMEPGWSKPEDRVIGYVVWAPPIGVGAPPVGAGIPHGYTKDVCVIKLDEKKFMSNFRGNVIDLGTEIGDEEFTRRMYPRDDAQSEFHYPEGRLLRLGSILSPAELRQPSGKDLNGDPVRYVIKRGLTTRTTIGRLTGFASCKRNYTALGKFDSTEVTIYPYNNDSGPFSKDGDSGALIAGPLAEFIALLTSGIGQTDSSDITYGTPIHWLWNDVIKPQFPGANLYFDLPKN